MKKLITVITVLLFFNSAFAQEIPKDILLRISETECIFEGKVIHSNAYWTHDHRAIYTSHTIQITKIFKGNIHCGTIELVTQGGKVDSTEEIVSDALELNVGNVGVFLCDSTHREISMTDFYPETNSKKLEAAFENQSFIKYWWDGYQVRVADLFYSFDSLAAVYDLTEYATQFTLVDCNNESIINFHSNSNVEEKEQIEKDLPITYNPEANELYKKTVKEREVISKIKITVQQEAEVLHIQCQIL